MSENRSHRIHIALYPMSEEEVARVIQRLNLATRPGDARVSAQTSLRTCVDSIDASLETGTFPSLLKTAEVVEEPSLMCK